MKTFSLRPSTLLCCLLLTLLSCQPHVNEAQELDPVYGINLAKLYSEKKVKEVFVERDHFYNRKLVYPRYLYQYTLLNRQGLPLRLESSHNDQISHRMDKEYDADSKVVKTVAFERAPGTTARNREGITWQQATRTILVASGKERAGVASWDASAGKWNPSTEVRTWVSNDTSYTETRKLYDPEGRSRTLERSYVSGNDPNLLRQDNLTFSPKGFRKASYYYTLVEHGKMVEYGELDFEHELYAYVEKHPQESTNMFSDHGFNVVLDKVARQTEGARKPLMLFTYDKSGRLTKQESPGYQTVQYQRDPQGRLKTSKEVFSDNSGRTITYFYDANGLLEKEVRVHLNGQPEETRYYRYTFFD